MDSSTQIIDLAYLKEMSGNNKEIMVEMVEIFIEQYPEFTEGISNYFENKQWTQLGAITHKAKSSFRIMGMSELGDCLEKIEHYSKGNQKVILQKIIKDNHKLDDEDLKVWNNIQYEDINDINLEYIPELIHYFLTQSPKAITELEKALREL